MSRRGRDNRKFRDVDGILVLDKALGITSNRALQQVRRLFQARKGGHCGSLDPLASGVLPICLGQATRFSGYLLGANKRYRAICRLGVTTTTGDAEGEVLETRKVDVNAARVAAACERFIGEIEQVPPMYSALKHEGRRLYQLAREGRQIDRAARQIKIFELSQQLRAGDELQLEVYCSKGTYIRTLAEDIGAELGCGAHLTALRRLAAEPFALDDAISFDALQRLAAEGNKAIDSRLMPVASALGQFPQLVLNPSDGLAIRHGKRVEVDSAGATGLHRLIAADGSFIGLGELFTDGVLQAKRLMNTAR